MNNTEVYCSHCGTPNEAQAIFCTKCGARQDGMISTPEAVAPPFPGTAGSPAGFQPVYVGGLPAMQPAPPNAAAYFRGYAGFWIRFVALLIDGVVIGVIFAPLWFFLFGAGFLGMLGAAKAGAHNPDAGALAIMPLIALLPIISLGAIAVNWLYDALLTSSSKQGTLGKMALGLKVVDTNGNRLSFLHATGRHFAKMINGFTFNIGYMMAGFTARKQGLHDLIAGTYVIKS